jgi:hypothetical protein
MAALLRRYQQALQRAPLRTNLCTAVPMMVVGDLCAQQLEARRRAASSTRELSFPAAVDLQRTVVMASYSGAVFTPIFFYLYKLQVRSRNYRSRQVH